MDGNHFWYCTMSSFSCPSRSHSLAVSPSQPLFVLRAYRTCLFFLNYDLPWLVHAKVEDEQRHLGALEDSFQQIKNTTGLSDVDDIIDR